MARKPELQPQQQLAMFLGAVGDHPWAGPATLQACGGLRARELQLTGEAALRKKLVESVRLPAAHNPPRRFALSPAGAAALGEPTPALDDLRDALLRASLLDQARRLLQEWTVRPGVRWALSPFTVYASDLKPPPGNSKRETPIKPREDKAYRSLRLDALAALTFSERQFLNVAILIDPGDIALTWFYHQFRSLYAWARREEFRQRAQAFPVLVLVAANRARLDGLVQVWQTCAGWGRTPEKLYATTQSALVNQPYSARPWWNERFGRTALWGGAVGDETASPKPSRIPPGQPGHTSPLISPVRKPETRQDHQRRHGLLGRHRGTASGQLVSDHLQVSWLGRELLGTIGRYPLLVPSELAAVLSVTRANIYASLSALVQQGLITRLAGDGRGYVLTGRGIALLAAQAGIAVHTYAGLRRWPLQWEWKEGRRELVYSIGALLANRAHTRLVAEFMLGLLRLGQLEPRFKLAHWDREYLVWLTDGRLTAERAWVVPDAVGAVQIRSRPDQQGDGQVTEFWLEVDRGSTKGRQLWRKLARYYEARSGQSLPRLLIVVERDDEARAQALRRRLNYLNTLHGRRLDVLITRVDLLELSRGRFDPARKVWRRPERWSELTCAFHGLPLRSLPLDGMKVSQVDMPKGK
jgi:hypothetical protein